jgi:YaiO family outer membrane protein
VNITRVSVAAFVLLATSVSSVQAQPGVVAEARRLAVSGQRPAALRLLDARLEEMPDDTDARTLRGLVYSWEGRRAEARADLELVLASIPTHSDALAALARVELWDGNSVRSEALATRGLAAHPQNGDLMEVRALALEQLSRYREARDQIDAILRQDSSRESARRIRRRLVEAEPAWFAGGSYRYDRFDDGRAGWSEAQVSLSRQSGIGTVGLRGYGAKRFGFTDYQIELEAYPRLRNGTYFYLAGAYAPDAVLYPERRGAADIYQSLGGGWEASVGVRRMEFASTVQIYTGALYKYRGNWLLSTRAWVNPDRDSDSLTLNFGARRYASDGESYWGLGYSRGTYRDDVRQVAEIVRLFSHAGSMELSRRIGRTYWGGSVSLSREERGPGDAFFQATFGLNARVRF